MSENAWGYGEVLDSQNGRCAICTTDTPGRADLFEVDHKDGCRGGSRLPCGSCTPSLICLGCVETLRALGHDYYRAVRLAEYMEYRAGMNDEYEDEPLPDGTWSEDDTGW